MAASIIPSLMAVSWNNNLGAWQVNGRGFYGSRSEAEAADTGSAPVVAPTAPTKNEFRVAMAPAPAREITPEQKAQDAFYAEQQRLFSQGYTDLDGDGSITDKDVKLSRTAYGTPISAGGTATERSVTTDSTGRIITGDELANLSSAWDSSFDSFTAQKKALETKRANAQNGNGQWGAFDEVQLTVLNDKLSKLGPRPGGTRPAEADPLGAAPVRPGLPTAPVLPVATGGRGGSGAPGEPGAPGDPASTPAEVDRERIDELLRSVNTATSGLLGIAQNQQDSSLAQAQLAISTQDAQRAALGQARSGSRRDRSMLERAAIAEGATLASDAGRSAALLRAQEEDANRKLRLDAYKAAGELGLNASALEVDINQLDMNAATNYLNQVFETNRLGLQIDQAEAERLTNFTRDMALIEQEYYALSQAERQSIRDDLTRRYGISEQSKSALEQIEKQREFSWSKFGSDLALGAVTGFSGAAATKLLASDRRAKTDIADTTEADLEELLAAVKSQTYAYKDPAKHGAGRQLGQMAQDLQKSKLGASLVSKSPDGTLQVDTGKAGLAALSGLALVFDKLKELEGAA